MSPRCRVKLAAVLASLRTIATDAGSTPERWAAARDAIRACGMRPAVRGCGALAVEDEIDVFAAGWARPHWLVLMRKID